MGQSSAAAGTRNVLYHPLCPVWYMFINSSPLDKMVAIVADDIFKRIFMNENDIVPIQIEISLIFVLTSPIYN